MHRIHADDEMYFDILKREKILSIIKENPKFGVSVNDDELLSSIIVISTPYDAIVVMRKHREGMPSLAEPASFITAIYRSLNSTFTCSTGIPQSIQNMVEEMFMDDSP